MALISCKECNNGVSDLAINCPKCGYKLRTPIINSLHTGVWFLMMSSLILTVVSCVSLKDVILPFDILVIWFVGLIVLGIIEKILRVFARPTRYEMRPW